VPQPGKAFSLKLSACTRECRTIQFHAQNSAASPDSVNSRENISGGSAWSVIGSHTGIMQVTGVTLKLCALNGGDFIGRLNDGKRPRHEERSYRGRQPLGFLRGNNSGDLSEGDETTRRAPVSSGLILSMSSAAEGSSRKRRLA
jgi:hypothetical protein